MATATISRRKRTIFPNNPYTDNNKYGNDDGSNVLTPSVNHNMNNGTDNNEKTKTITTTNNRSMTAPAPLYQHDNISAGKESANIWNKLVILMDRYQVYTCLGVACACLVGSILFSTRIGFLWDRLF